MAGKLRSAALAGTVDFSVEGERFRFRADVRATRDGWDWTWRSTRTGSVSTVPELVASPDLEGLRCLLLREHREGAARNVQKPEPEQ